MYYTRVKNLIHTVIEKTGDGEILYSPVKSFEELTESPYSFYQSRGMERLYINLPDEYIKEHVLELIYMEE